MAEFPQSRLELLVPEIQQIRRTRLLTEEEIKELVKNRRKYEYKIMSNDLQDFISYIQHEKSLLELIQLRRNSLKTGEKKNQIEHSILNRIKHLYEKIVERFPSNKAQHLEYFKFCKQVNYVNAASAAISNMIKHHSDSVETWQIAAKWYACDRKDISTALKTICKGLSMHKESKLLYMEAIQLEIQNADDGSWQGSSLEVKLSEKKILCLEKLTTYFKEITIHIDDCEYYVDILEYLEKYDFTKPFQKTIIEYVVEKYRDKAVTWNMLAQRDRKGLPSYLHEDVKELGLGTTKMKLTKCIETYKNGLEKVPQQEKEILWSFYINCLLDARQEDPGVAIKLKTDSLKEAFKKASAENLLYEKYYMQWLEIVDDKDKLEILAKATIKFPQSLELWKYYLKTTMQMTENKQKIARVFNEAKKALNERALPLWTNYLRYHLLYSDVNTVDAIYKEAVNQPQEISDVLKPDYLEFLTAVKSTAAVREEYRKMAAVKPYCKELHNTMFRLETVDLKIDFDMCDEIHNLACQQFGKEDVEVWLNRIHYYIGYKQGKVKKEEFEKTLKEAQEALPPVLFSHFKAKYYAMAVKIE